MFTKNKVRQKNEQSKEKIILWISFWAGLIFALSEFVFAIYSRSQSALMDAAYDASELVFIVLILFLTPLFHRPISEKRPYGFAQIESIFIIIKGFMMMSVTLGLSANVVQAIINGGTQVDGNQISIFQLVLGIASVFIYLIMRRLNRSLSSPTVKAELLGWKMDIVYSLGMSAAFFVSGFMKGTRFDFVVPYFDQIMALAVIIFTLPESIKMLWGAVKDVFLFSPNEEMISEIKKECADLLKEAEFYPVFFDITRTGRQLWVAIYFQISEEILKLETLQKTSELINNKLKQQYENCNCELILVPEKGTNFS